MVRDFNHPAIQVLFEIPQEFSANESDDEEEGSSDLSFPNTFPYISRAQRILSEAIYNAGSSETLETLRWHLLF